MRSSANFSPSGVRAASSYRWLQRLPALLVLLGFGLTTPRVFADSNTLCGSVLDTPNTTIALIEDLDCTGYVDAVFTIAADNVTIDGGFNPSTGTAYKILAPDSAVAVIADGPNGLTVKNLIVDGWCNGTGIRIVGGTNHLIQNVTATGRAIGVELDGAVGPVTIDGLTTNEAAQTGLLIKNMAPTTAAPLILRDLHLGDSLQGLRLEAFGSAAETYPIYAYAIGTPPGVVDTTNGAIVGDLSGSDTGIMFAGVTNVTVQGPPTGSGGGLELNGVTAGIDASNPTNRDLTFKDLNVSTSFGTGYGIHLSGSDCVVQDVVAGQRNIGVEAVNTTRLRITRLNATGATTTGLHVKSPTHDQPTDAPVLEALTLEGCAVGLHLEGVSGFRDGPPSNYQYHFAVTPHGAGGGMIASVENSDTGIKLTDVDGVAIGEALPTQPLALDNTTYGIDARSNLNNALVFQNLVLSAGSSGLGFGLDLGGPGHHVSDIIVERRRIGLRLNGAAGEAARITDVRLNGNGIGLQFFSFLNASTVPDFSNINARDNGVGVSTDAWDRGIAYTFEKEVLDGNQTVANTTSQIDVTGSRKGITTVRTKQLNFRGQTLGNSLAGLEIQNSCQNMQLSDLNVSGAGLGIGLDIYSGTGLYSITATNIIANDRGTGVRVGYASDVNLVNITAQRSNVGLEFLAAGSYGLGSMPNVNGANLRDNNIGFLVKASNQSQNIYAIGEARDDSLDPNLAQAVGIDVSGSYVGISITDMTKVKIHGTPAKPDGTPAKLWKLNNMFAVRLGSHST